MGRLSGGQMAAVRKHAVPAGAIAVVAGTLARLHLDGQVAGAVAVATHEMAVASRGGAGEVWRVLSGAGTAGSRWEWRYGLRSHRWKR